MEKEISIQIHDYDRAGRYVITEERKATLDEVHELKETARKSVKADWWRLPREATHIVYYAELVDKQNCVWFAGIYMHGEAYDEKDFDRIFCKPEVGYVGAIHKRV